MCSLRYIYSICVCILYYFLYQFCPLRFLSVERKIESTENWNKINMLHNFLSFALPAKEMKFFIIQQTTRGEQQHYACLWIMFSFSSSSRGARWCTADALPPWIRFNSLLPANDTWTFFNRIVSNSSSSAVKQTHQVNIFPDKIKHDV